MEGTYEKSSPLGKRNILRTRLLLQLLSLARAASRAVMYQSCSSWNFRLEDEVHTSTPSLTVVRGISLNDSKRRNNCRKRRIELLLMHIDEGDYVTLVQQSVGCT